METSDGVRIAGREFTREELDQVRETVRLFPRLSRYELAQTVCEHLGWTGPSGRNKVEACQQLLGWLEHVGEIELPALQVQQRHPGPDRAPRLTPRSEPSRIIRGPLAEVEPVALQPVSPPQSPALWNEYVHRYHPLGYRRPFGAHQRYFIVGGEGRERLGCLLFAASAWALAPRDRWIGWTEEDRSQRLHLVVSNSRFLLFPWVQVPNLASRTLALAARRLPEDWEARYGYRPVLLESFVDVERYRGTCYRAANWIYLGNTRGRGRMDRFKEYPSSPKAIYVYPLRQDFRAWLCGRTKTEGGAPR